MVGNLCIISGKILLYIVIALFRVILIGWNSLNRCAFVVLQVLIDLQVLGSLKLRKQGPRGL